MDGSREWRNGGDVHIPVLADVCRGGLVVGSRMGWTDPTRPKKKSVPDIYL